MELENGSIIENTKTSDKPIRGKRSEGSYKYIDDTSNMSQEEISSILKKFLYDGFEVREFDRK